MSKLPTGQVDIDAVLNIDSYRVFVRSNSGAGWDGKKFVIPRGGILVPRSYYIANRLRADGYPVQEIIKSSEEGLRLLADGVADVAVLFGQGFSELAQSAPFRDEVREAPIPYLTVAFYLLFSRPAYLQDRKRIEAIWNGIREERQ